MIKIGITGGIGSGKTTVCKVFENMGIPVYYADEHARNITLFSDESKKAILTKFGAEILDTYGEIDRLKLASIIFSDKANTQWLNELIHPLVKIHFENWITQHKTSKIIVKEAALIFESGSDKLLDAVYTVIRPLEDRITSVMQRSNLSRLEVEDRMNKQSSDDFKIEKSTGVIYNDNSDFILDQVCQILSKYLP